MKKVIASIAGMVLFSAPAFATTIAVPVPEPSTLGLLAIGVAGVVIATRLRNRK
ncbi:MAG: PEP-CTERM sorting domain-containing protein [Alphaproteobacteria bacterium]|nr:PEP-CTERM sorting domain-containing protein [Alphaproteobacteria bacterium]